MGEGEGGGGSIYNGLKVTHQNSGGRSITPLTFIKGKSQWGVSY
jgi:hypothetical protein